MRSCHSACSMARCQAPCLSIRATAHAAWPGARHPVCLSGPQRMQHGQVPGTLSIYLGHSTCSMATLSDYPGHSACRCKPRV